MDSESRRTHSALSDYLGGLAMGIRRRHCLDAGSPSRRTCVQVLCPSRMGNLLSRHSRTANQLRDPPSRPDLASLHCELVSLRSRPVVAVDSDDAETPPESQAREVREMRVSAGSARRRGMLPRMRRSRAEIKELATYGMVTSARPRPTNSPTNNACVPSLSRAGAAEWERAGVRAPHSPTTTCLKNKKAPAKRTRHATTPASHPLPEVRSTYGRGQGEGSHLYSYSHAQRPASPAKHSFPPLQFSKCRSSPHQKSAASGSSRSS